MFRYLVDTHPEAAEAALVKKFIQSWFINTLAVLVAVYLVKGIRYDKPLDLLVASLLLGILNAVLRPILLFLALPLLIVTLGLFTLVIMPFFLTSVANCSGLHFFVTNFFSPFWRHLLFA